MGSAEDTTAEQPDGAGPVDDAVQGPAAGGGVPQAGVHRDGGPGAVATRRRLPRWWLLPLAVAVVVLAVVVRTAGPDHGGGRTAPTTTLPADVGLGELVRPDPSVRFPGPVVVQQLSATSLRSGLVSGYILPCQRVHSVKLTQGDGGVDVELLAGVARGTTSCDGDPHLVTTRFTIPVSLQSQVLRPAAPRG